MALALANRIRETCSSPGTGAVTLLGAVTGYQTFAVIGNGNTTYYCIADQTGANWEVGIGTYSTTGPTLTRTTPLSGSSTTPVNFSSGTQDVFVMMPAEKAVGSQTGYFDATFKGTFIDGIVIDYDSSSGNGRISVGGADGIYFYNGGVGNTILGSVSNAGDWDFNGNIVVGTGTPLGGATNPLFSANASSNNYVQGYVHNTNVGVSASADLVAYTDNSTDSHGWADIGFTSSVYADTTYTCTGPNEAYLFGSALNSSYTGNLVYATDSTGSANAHQWYVGGFTQAKTAFKMQLNATNLLVKQPIQANGIIESTTGGFKFPDGTTQTTAASGSGGGLTAAQVYLNNMVYG